MDEKQRILEMVANKTITAEEAAKLLMALNPSQAVTKNHRGKRLHIEIKQDHKEKPLLNLSIPINLAKIGLIFIPNNTKLNANIPNSNFDFSQIDWKQILAMAQSDEIGELFYMEVDEDNGESTTIRIYID